MKKWSWILLLLVAAGACKEKTKKEVAGVSMASTERVFKPVEVPMTYTDPQQQVEYLVARFWDNFDFTDTAFIHLPEITERAFGAYVQNLNAVPKAKAVASVKKTWRQATTDTLVLTYFAGLFEKYLYDPNSPVANEDLYVTVLELLVDSGAFSEEERARATHRLEMALKNRLGTRAADFSFTLASGKKMRLYNIKTEYILLFFNNPGCHTCKQYSDVMRASSLLSSLVRDGRMQVIAVYPDEDLAEWRAYLPHIPGEWLNGYDEHLALRGKKLYSLRAIPTLYLLNKDKTVLLRDVPYELVEQYLMATAQNTPTNK